MDLAIDPRLTSDLILPGRSEIVVPFLGDLVTLPVPSSARVLVRQVRTLIEVAGMNSRLGRSFTSNGGYGARIAKAIAAAHAGGEDSWKARIGEDDDRAAVWRRMSRPRPLGTPSACCDAVAFAALRVGDARSDFRDLVTPEHRSENRAVLSAALGHAVLGHPRADCAVCAAIAAGDWSAVLAATGTHPAVAEDLVIQLGAVGRLPRPLEGLLPKPELPC